MDDNFYTCPDCKESMPRLRKMNHINKECPAKKKEESKVIPLFGLLLGNLLNSEAFNSYVSNSKDSKSKMEEIKKTEDVKKMKELSKKINNKNDFEERFSQSIKNSQEIKSKVEEESNMNDQLINGMVKAIQVAALLEKLPKGEIQDPEKLQPCDKKCFLCKNEFQKGERILILPCKHIYHIDHITSFLMERMCCPICSFLKEMNIILNIVENINDNEE